LPFSFGEILTKFRQNKPLFRHFVSAKYFDAGVNLGVIVASLQLLKVQLLILQEVLSLLSPYQTSLQLLQA
jgi:hypothetical protein